MLTFHLAAGSLVLPLSMNQSPSLPASNGHLSPLANNVINAEAVASDSESDLSDIVDPSNPRGLSSLNGRLGFSGNNDTNNINAESSNDDDGAGSEDADYDMETPPPLEGGTAREERSLSHDSRRPAKRKAGLEDDEHIMNNPELYGLRRSVSRPTVKIKSFGTNVDTRAVLVHLGALYVQTCCHEWDSLLSLSIRSKVAPKVTDQIQTLWVVLVKGENKSPLRNVLATPLTPYRVLLDLSTPSNVPYVGSIKTSHSSSTIALGLRI